MSVRRGSHRRAPAGAAYRAGRGYLVTAVPRCPAAAGDLTTHIATIRWAAARACRISPFVVAGWAVLPGGMHCLWMLPAGDDDFMWRWRLFETAAGHWMLSPDLKRRLLESGRRGGVSPVLFRVQCEEIRRWGEFASRLDGIHALRRAHGDVEYVSEWPYLTLPRSGGDTVACAVPRPAEVW